jgi:hypothetical protein
MSPEGLGAKRVRQGAAGKVVKPASLTGRGGDQDGRDNDIASPAGESPGARRHEAMIAVERCVPA